jgi:putative flippase GtrA
VWLSDLYQRFRDLVHELGKFGIVGSVAYVVDSLMLLALLQVTDEPLTAKTLATVVSASVAFVGNRFWTWRHRERSGLAREYGLYFGLNVVGLAIALGCVWVSHYWLGSLWPAFQTDLANFIAANVVGLAAGTMFRFWSYRRFVFLAPARAPGAAELSATIPDR